MEFNEMLGRMTFQYSYRSSRRKTKFCQIDSLCLCRVTLDVVFLRLGNRFFLLRRNELSMQRTVFTFAYA